VLDRLMEEHGRPKGVRSDNGPEFTSRCMLGWTEERKVQLVHSSLTGHAERPRRELPRKVTQNLKTNPL